MAGKSDNVVAFRKSKLEANILIIDAPYYADVSKELRDGAIAELEARGCAYEVIEVPGALEIPQVLAQAAERGLISGSLVDEEAITAALMAQMQAEGPDDPDDNEFEEMMAELQERMDNSEPVKRYDGVIALGCVIRGETSHYDIVCNNANHWLMQTVTEMTIPFGNAILTVDNHEQAMKRASGGREGKGGDAARACLSVIEIARKFDGYLS